MGTRLNDLQVTKVTDGDTIKVQHGAEVLTIRYACIDTEESLAGGDKPVTQAGLKASEWAKGYFTNPDGSLAQVDLEFDTDDPLDLALVRHLDNFGRLLCYVHKGGENVNLRLIRDGWSPYFVKYGRSRIYDEEMTRAEAEAQANNQPIWDPTFNAGGNTRDYSTLLPWWTMRALVVDDYRSRGVPAGVLSVRLDYQRLLDAATAGDDIVVFCDLQDGVHRWAGGGALIYAGSIEHKFNLWIPDVESDASEQIIRLIERRYKEPGRGYCYVSGTAVMYGSKPQIVLTGINQISDFPPV